MRHFVDLAGDSRVVNVGVAVAWQCVDIVR